MNIVLKTLQEFGLTFLPLFVAMDAISVVPILLPLTQDMQSKERRRVIRFALLTALGLGLGFVIIGKAIFIFLGITVNDFLIAGGLFLFLLAAKEVIMGKMFDAEASIGAEMVGVVPIGTPLVVGPAVLTTLLILIDRYNIFTVIVAFIINLLIAWLFFAQANRLVRLLGQSGVKAVTKIMGLLLAAIAVKMVRDGIFGIISAGH